MPSENTRKLEGIAWNTLDKYIKDNPKPRLSARTRHRMKLWLVSFIPDRVNYKETPNNYVLPLRPEDTDRMMDYAHSTLDD